MRGYLVMEGGNIEIVNRPVVDGIPHDNIGYPMERTNETRELIGWPDDIVRVWLSGSNEYLFRDR